MTVCDDTATISGRSFLFLGIETINWQIAQFEAAAQFAHSYGIDSLLIKCGDGTNEWYKNWNEIKTSIHDYGVGAIPYFYMYGEKLGGHAALETEVGFLIKYMASDGIVCADIEAEWQNNPGWGTYVTSMLLPVKGKFLLTTFADPNEISTSYGSLIHNLSPCVDSFLPQQYDSYLALKWPDFAVDGAVCLFPIVDMTQEFGANNPVEIVKNALIQGHKAYGVWEYSTALANKPLLAQVVASFPKVVPTEGETFMSEQALACWNATMVPTQHLIVGSAIATEWNKAYATDTSYGPAVSPEIKTVDKNGNVIIFQYFVYGFASYQSGKTTFFGGLKL